MVRASSRSSRLTTSGGGGTNPFVDRLNTNPSNCRLATTSGYSEAPTTSSMCPRPGGAVLMRQPFPERRAWPAHGPGPPPPQPRATEDRGTCPEAGPASEDEGLDHGRRAPALMEQLVSLAV